MAGAGAAKMVARETTSTNAATTTSLLAITTPFVQPPECASIWDITTASITINTTITKQTTIILSDPADERFARCQIPGWDSVGSQRFSFSPAVCPRGWTYWEMSTEQSYTDNKHIKTRSTAFCCSEGYSLSRNYDRANITASCFHTMTAGETVTGTFSHGKGSTVIFTSGIQVHPAWQISWEASDTKTMSPSLPVLTNSMRVPTWVPGETIPPGKYEMGSDRQDYNPGWDTLMRFIMIGIPIIGVALIASGVWCYICCRRARPKEKRKEEESKRQREAVSESTS